MSCAIMRKNLTIPPVEALKRAFRSVKCLTEYDAVILANDASGILVNPVPRRSQSRGRIGQLRAAGAGPGELRAARRSRHWPVHVLDPQVERLAHAQAATVEQPDGRAGGKISVGLDRFVQLPGVRRSRGAANLGWSSGSQGLDVFQIRVQGLLVEKQGRIKGLILRAGGDILFGLMNQNPFQLLFARQMRRKPFEVLAISPEPGAVSPLSGERQMLPPKHFRESAHCFIGIHTAIFIHEPPVVFKGCHTTHHNNLAIGRDRQNTGTNRSARMALCSMKTTTLITVFCAVVLSPAQAGTIGVDPTSGGAALVSGFGGLTLGWEFQVSDTNGIVVDGLGFWDQQSDGFLFGQTFQVGLWDASTGTLLRDSVITSASTLKPSLDPDGGWRVNSVSPLYLAPGLYRIGGLMPVSGANQIIDFGATVQSGTGVSLVGFLRQIGSSTLAMPDIPPPTLDSAYFGPTFTFTRGPAAQPGVVVAPGAYTATSGTTGLNTLLRNNGFPRTYQMQFSPAALGGLPVGTRITELRFRLITNAVAFPTNTVTWSDYQVTLAQAAKPISGMSTNFASNMLSPVLVKSGALSIGANSFTRSASLNSFGSLVVFDTPYVYRGGDLVMLFRHTGSDSGNTAFLDAVNSSTPGYGTDFRAFSTNSFNATGGSQASVTIAQMVFTYSLGEIIFRDGTNVVIVGTGALPGATGHIMASTNIALPSSQWTPVATKLFDGSGSFRYTNAINADLPARYFRIELP